MSETAIIAVAAMVCAMWLFLTVFVGVGIWKKVKITFGSTVLIASVITVIAIVVVA